MARSEDPPGGTGPEESSEPDSRTPLEDLLESAPEPPRPRRRTRVPLRLRREVLGVALVAVLAVVCAGLIVAVALKTRNDTALAAREAASYTPPPLTGSSPAGATGPAIAIISDETATRAASGVGASDRWPRLLRTALEARVTTIASTGAGFVSEGANGRTFEDAASDVPTDADTVLFVGGSADASSTSIAVASAATRAIAAAEQRAPDAKIIVVGPLYAPASATAEQTTALRAALRSSARVAEVPWVDPVDSNWLGNVDTTGALTAAAERTVTSRLRTVISSAPSR